MADVFISYKSERRAAAEHLAEILTDYGYSVWWDYGLISGRDFGAQIERELRAASAVVVLWCSMAVGSEWVREEAALAKRLAKIIPTFIERVDLPLGFSLSQTLDLSDWDGAPLSRRLTRLLRDIAQLVGRAPSLNETGLEKTERAWRRFGAPTLREFSLIDALERELPPRTLPGALHPPSEPEPSRRNAIEDAWAAIDQSIEASHYRRFERAFGNDATAFKRIVEAETRAKILERWAEVDKTNAEEIADAMRDGSFPALDLIAEDAARRATQDAEARRSEEIEARAKPRAIWRDSIRGLPASGCPEMITLPPGTFLMGNELTEAEYVYPNGPPPRVSIDDLFNPERSSKLPLPEQGIAKALLALGRAATFKTEIPRHEVTLGYSFAIGRFPVTFLEWDGAIQAGAKLAMRGEKERDQDRHLAIEVSWDVARTYLNWLNEALGLSGRADAYRLPSEAEWEYACRQAAMARLDRPKIWEWCEDIWHDNYEGAPSDGSAWLAGGDNSCRVLRGGAFEDGDFRITSRKGSEFSSDFFCGFRLARTLAVRV